MAEVRLGFDADAGRFVPALSPALETSVPGLYLAGDAAAPGPVETGIADGWIAGLEAARSLGLRVSDQRLAAARERHAAVAPGRMSSLTRVFPAFDQVDRGGMERQP
jgi:heterodisulfide reductase subunit A-like polyferredoxin